MSGNQVLRFREKVRNITVQEIARMLFCGQCMVRTGSCEPWVLQAEDTYMDSTNLQDEIDTREFSLRCRKFRRATVKEGSLYCRDCTEDVHGGDPDDMSQLWPPVQPKPKD